MAITRFKNAQKRWTLFNFEWFQIVPCMLHVLMNVNTKRSKLERMKCDQLRSELAKRNLKQTGKKAELIGRLQRILDLEAQENPIK